MPDDRPERQKYGRASLREQLGGELSALLDNTPLVILLTVVIGGGLLLAFMQPTVVRVGELAAGDCLYIRAADVNTDPGAGRPIGSDAAAIVSLFTEGAERAGCDASHSHEVADAWILADALVAPYPGQAELTARERARCEAAFERHVGRPAEGSALRLTVAVPPDRAWADGARAAACLVSEGNGRFLTTPARGSGR